MTDPISGRCELCREPIHPDRLIGHLRRWHPDAWDLWDWPEADDGAVIVDEVAA